MSDPVRIARGSVLVVDDEEGVRESVRAVFEESCDVLQAGTGSHALDVLRGHDVDVVLLDHRMPGESGIDVLPRLVAADPSVVVVVVSAVRDVRMAVEAMRRGAYDYLTKPFDVDEIRLVVRRALEKRALEREVVSLRSALAEGPPAAANGFGGMVGRHPAMMRIYQLIAQIAETPATVLITGESGTGKELIARAIHHQSDRRTAPFVAVNVAAIPDTLIESELFGHERGAFTGASARRHGKFEQAQGGTLFLDEIGDMSANVQAKLLRALEERKIERLGGGESIPVDVRIVSATHRPLEQDIAAGSFRADLFYRLRVVTIDIPPLRERREDIPVLAETFARLACERYSLPRRTVGVAALRRLVEYRWPGNVRGLKNAVERSVILAEGDELTARDLPEEIRAGPGASAEAGAEGGEAGALNVPFTADFREDRREFERRYIARCLEETGGNVTRAATILGMHRQSLQHKLRELGMARRYVSVGQDDAQEKSDN